MNIYKRAFIYITRKKAKSMILFVLFFVVNLFLLISIAVHTAAIKEADNVKATLPTGITIRLQPIESIDVFDFNKNEKGELDRTLKIPLLRQSKLDEILKSESADGYFENSDVQKYYTGLKLRPGLNTTVVEEYGKMDYNTLTDEEKEDYKSSKTSMFACGFYPLQEGRWHPFFRNGAIQIQEGRNIKKSDQSVAVISEELASNNDLEIGDTLEISSFAYISGDLYGEPLALDIIGIYRINFEEQVGYFTDESLILSNLVFTDEEIIEWGISQWDTYYKEDHVVPLEDPVVTSVTIYAKDPDSISNLEASIGAVDSVDWSYYDIERYDQDYKAVAKPLLMMVNLSNIMIVIMSIGSLILLALLMGLWMQSRKNEIQILSRIGVKSRNVLAQLILECCLIAGAALILSSAVAIITTEQVGNLITESFSPSDNSQGFENSINERLELEIKRAPAKIESIQYHYNAWVLLMSFGIIIVIIIISIVVSYFRVTKKIRRQ